MVFDENTSEEKIFQHSYNEYSKALLWLLHFAVRKERPENISILVARSTVNEEHVQIPGQRHY